MRPPGQLTTSEPTAYLTGTPILSGGMRSPGCESQSSTNSQPRAGGRDGPDTSSWTGRSRWSSCTRPSSEGAELHLWGFIDPDLAREHLVAAQHSELELVADLRL